MRKCRRPVVRAILLAAAFLMAVQPLALALGLTQQAAKSASDWGPIVICTAHGPVTLSDGDPVSPPAQKAPSCPYCALGCNGGLAKLVLAVSTPEIRTPFGVVAFIGDPILVEAPRQLLRLLTSPPRAPPSYA